MFLRFMGNLFKCRHKNAILYASEGYCPDCGIYVRKNYYIVRCKWCKTKRLAKKSFNEIVPCEKYCINCGENEFIVEKCEKLNLVDINYALEVKETAVQFGESEKIEIWVENEKKPDVNNSDALFEKKYLPRFS